MFHIFTHLSGHPSHRGSFETYEEAKAKQAELHAQGWYYVPLMTTEQAEAERYTQYIGKGYAVA